jgi:hypothetical protein
LFKRTIIPALFLFIPIAIFNWAYWFNHDPNLIPTGFMQYDNVGYVAYAKQYLDEPSKSLFYSNPFNDSPQNSKIYFQTQTLILSGLMKMGVAPGISICIFSAFFAFLSILMAIKLYDSIFPNTPFRNTSLLLLIWGGGLLVIAGIMMLPFRYKEGYDFFSQLFYLDPAGGWWGLNLGRALFPGTESYFHFLFLSALFFLVNKKWLPASITSFVLSISHPFTGIQLLLIIITWVFIEKILFKNKTLPWWLVVIILCISGIHLFYYLYYLPSFSDHKSVSDQYSLDWHYSFYNFIPAYILVFTLFIVTVKIKQLKDFINHPSNRLFLCMAAVSALLSNHELFMKPMQPVHFTRGYEWTAYFFMGIPALHFLLNKLKFRTVLAISFISLMLLDNFLWIVNHIRNPKASPVAYITKEQQDILTLLNKKVNTYHLILSSDDVVPYLSTIYTKGYPWISHPFTTSFYQEKFSIYDQFLATGQVDEKWNNRKLILILSHANKTELSRLQLLPLNFKRLFIGKNYTVLSNN